MQLSRVMDTNLQLLLLLRAQIILGSVTNKIGDKKKTKHLQMFAAGGGGRKTEPDVSHGSQIIKGKRDCVTRVVKL